MRQYKKLPTLITALAFCALAVLTISFLFSPLNSTDAQEQKSVPLADSASLDDAEKAGIVTQMPIDSIEVPQTNFDTPEGSLCSWVAAPVIPAPVLDQATTSVGSNLYVFSGVSAGALVATSRKFDGTVWSTIAPLPAALEFPTAVSDGTSAYIINGTNGSLTPAGTQNTLYRYNPAANTYTTLAPSASATSTWNHASAYLNGKIYKIGGFNTVGTVTTTISAVEIYDIATNTWSTGADYPLALGFMSAFVRGNFVYVAGGFSSATGAVPSVKTYRYDPATNTWDDAAIADLPDARWGAASSQTGYGAENGWVLAGGFVSTTPAISNTVTNWDPATNTWSALSNLLQARARMTGALLGSSFHVIGGRSADQTTTATSFLGNNDNQKLTCLNNVAVPTAGTITISGESCGTPNNLPDPGETLTVTLPLTNAGDTATANLTAVLQASGGVVSAVTQNYGAITPGGAAVSRNFTFTVDSSIACGSTVTLTFALTDGTTSYGNITRSYTTGIRSVTTSQNFDGVTAPALPTGWTTAQLTGTGITWVTTTTTPNSAPNAAFANDPATVSLSALITPAISITSADSQITFKNKYNTESGTLPTAYDGAVLEYTTNGGTTWTDVITGGGTFVSGGYNALLSTGTGNTLPGRNAWAGNSNGYLDTVVNLPAALNGQTVQFRWLMGADNTVGVTGGGIWIDDVQVLGARVCNTCSGGTCRIQRRNDFNGDGKTDFSVFRPSNNTWYIQPSGGTSFYGVAFGATGDKLVPSDYDGDGKTDIAVFRSGTWYWIKSSDNTVQIVQWGSSTDTPVVGDYTGDGSADLAVYRPSNGVWYIRNSTGGALIAMQYGAGTDTPVVGDFDGDCKIDLAVRRTSSSPVQYFILRSATNTSTSVFWGTAAMLPAIGDYDGDGKSDIGVVNLSNGVYNWYVISTTNTVLVNGTTYGATNDVMVPGDYDGDGKTDLAYWRPSTGSFFFRVTGSATTGFSSFGASGDVPTARAYQQPLP